MAIAEGKYAGEFIVSEANGTRSKTTGTVLSGSVLSAGELVGKVTASGKYAPYNPAGADGTQTVAGISFDNVADAGADVAGKVFIVRDAEVRGSDLTYNEAVAGVVTAEIAGLLALGIIVR